MKAAALVQMLLRPPLTRLHMITLYEKVSDDPGGKIYYYCCNYYYYNYYY